MKKEVSIFNSKKFGDHVSAYRNKHELTMIDLGKKANIGLSIIFSMENGERIPRIDYVYKICKLLHPNKPGYGILSYLSIKKQ